MEVTIDQCWEMNLTSTLQRKPTTYQCMTTNIENQSTRQHKTEFQWTGMSLRDENNTDNQSTHEMKTDTSQSIHVLFLVTIIHITGTINEASRCDSPFTMETFRRLKSWLFGGFASAQMPA